MDAHKARMRTSSEDPNWRTPPEMVKVLGAVFPIEVDLAATLDAHVGTHLNLDIHAYFGPDHPRSDWQDSLRVPWHDFYKVGFLNAPYSISKIRELRKVQKEEEREFSWSSASRQAWEERRNALRIADWARKAYEESLLGFTTIGVFPYAPQTDWFRAYVMGHTTKRKTIYTVEDRAVPFHAALDYWRIPHRVNFLRSDGSKAANANVNTCVVIWGPNPGFVGPWVPSGRYWDYR